jgi:hypothetical protein
LESSRLLPGQDEGRKGANSVERISFISSFFYYIFYCCCRLGYIVAFTKVLTICQINHTWIHPFTILLHSLSPPPLLTQFQQISFFYLHACVHSICTIFTLLRNFPTFSILPQVPISPGKTCSTLLLSDFV